MYYYESDSVDDFVSDFRLVSGRVVSFSVFRTSLESRRFSCYIKNNTLLISSTYNLCNVNTNLDALYSIKFLKAILIVIIIK